MKIADNIHGIRIDFNVTEQIKRFVYVYLIEGKRLYLIDTGVAGSEKEIAAYLRSIGRDMNEVAGILLTHSHPDHIGAASKIKDASGCFVYSSQQERSWIEDIDLQFSQRPIPNFYQLLNCPVSVDKTLTDGDILPLEPGITIQVLNTKGHSHGSLSYLWQEASIMLTGDAIPVIGDIPIYDNITDSIDSLEKILSYQDIRFYLSSWDTPQNNMNGRAAITESLKLLTGIKSVVQQLCDTTSEIKTEEIVEKVCSAMNLEKFKDNPLFRKSIAATIATWK